MDRPHDDPGLQPERTTLSWGRTMMSLLVTSMLILRWAGVFGALTLVPAVAALAAVVGILVTQRRRYAQQSRGIATSLRGAHPLDIVLLGGSVVVVAATEALIIALG